MAKQPERTRPQYRLVQLLAAMFMVAVLAGVVGTVWTADLKPSQAFPFILAVNVLPVGLLMVMSLARSFWHWLSRFGRQR
jgi:magnesium-transporting ATPase (P-type)